MDEIKQASLPQFKFADLPFAESVKVVKGSPASRKVAIFEDPNCGYCKKLEKSILDIGDVTIYVFLYPVLGPDSLAKSKQVWCSPPIARRAWTDWMQNVDGADRRRQLRDAARPQTLAARPQAASVDGTPTLFFSNGKRVEGDGQYAQDLEKLARGVSGTGQIAGWITAFSGTSVKWADAAVLKTVVPAKAGTQRRCFGVAGASTVTCRAGSTTSDRRCWLSGPLTMIVPHALSGAPAPTSAPAASSVPACSAGRGTEAPEEVRAHRAVQVPPRSRRRCPGP